MAGVVLVSLTMSTCLPTDAGGSLLSLNLSFRVWFLVLTQIQPQPSW